MTPNEIIHLKTDLKNAVQESARMFMVSAQKMIEAEDTLRRDAFFQETMRHLAAACQSTSEWRIRVHNARKEVAESASVDHIG